MSDEARGALICSRKDPYNYSDPSENFLSAGVPLSAISGTRGIVVPKASQEGGLCGYDPHLPRVVYIAPPDGSRTGPVAVDLSQITAAEINQLTQSGSTIRRAGDDASARETAALAMESMAEFIANRPARAPLTKESEHSMLSPSARFNQAQQLPTSSPVPSAACSNGSEVRAGTLPPMHKVVFEIEGFGALEAHYHEISREDDRLLLAYDRRFSGGMRYMPPDLGPDGKLFIDVAAFDEVFVARSIGVTVPFREFDLCILFIEKSAPKQ